MSTSFFVKLTSSEKNEPVYVNLHNAFSMYRGSRDYRDVTWIESRYHDSSVAVLETPEEILAMDSLNTPAVFLMGHADPDGHEGATGVDGCCGGPEGREGK